MDDSPPTAKRQKTTAPVEDENEPAILDEESKGATVKADRTVMDLLRSLPANIVAIYIYPFAVKVIKNREELIEAVDEYLDEFYCDDDEDEVSWSDKDEDDSEDTSSDDEEAKEQDASSTFSDDHISSSDLSHQNSSMEPRGSDELQDGDEDDEEEHYDEDVPSSDEYGLYYSDQNRIRYPIGDWDVSGVDDFTSVFDSMKNRKAKNFNEDLSRWNVANGTSFARMFVRCPVFQSDLSNWNTGRATNLWCMFNGCKSFQSDISRWNVANATDLSWMFFDCSSFNSDVSRWDLANATNLNYMFYQCTSFNSDVSQWDVANAGPFTKGMFRGCDSFDRTFVATWPLPDVQSVERLFEDSG
jgi:surface protein